MILKKTSICIFLFGMILFGVVNSQRITIPLKKNIDNEFQITVKYGLDQCEVNLKPIISYCSNTISEKVEIPNHCGSQFVGDVYQGKTYAAPFQLGDTEADLLFTIPNQSSTSNGVQSFCLGIGANGSNNALEELFVEKKITSRVAYFYLNSANSSSNIENGVVGTLAIGEPIQSLSKGNFVTLKKGSNDDAFTASSQRSIQAFGQTLDSRSVVYINISTPFTSLTVSAYEQLLQIFTSRGINYTIVPGTYDQQTYLDSIDQLEPIIFTLTKEDQISVFEVSLAPSQYTTKQADGTFQLLISPLYYTGSISIGNTILESYNIGYDLGHKRILIAHQSESQNNNFRGTHIKL